MNDIIIPKRAYDNPEFLASPEARTIRILSEYLEPLSRFDRLKVNSTILFLGSAQADERKKRSPLYKYYWEAEDLAFRLTKWAIPLKPQGKNFVVCTGAGPGIMEAANRGARRAGGKTIGLNISLPHEQKPNPFISPDLAFTFHYFFMRKFWLISRAKAVIAFPGGYGTCDELFEMLTLVQTGKIEREDVVIVLYGEKYWRKILNFEAMIAARAITPEDTALFTFVSEPGKAFSFLRKKLMKFCRVMGPLS
ncbi:MAG: LOG family protein [Candidatus Aminicenantales bacterium]|jgi:uncharacterized protein (TIGR00730 family)